MTVYANLVDGEVKGVYDLIPKFWNGINNFNIRCLNDPQFMADNNFVKITKQSYEYNSETHYLSDFPTYTVQGNSVIENRAIIQKIEQIPEPPSQDLLLERVRTIRDQKMRNFEWRYNRYHRQVRLNLPTTDNIEDLDQYMQALADITTQEDLSNPVWPEF